MGDRNQVSERDRLDRPFGMSTIATDAIEGVRLVRSVEQRRTRDGAPFLRLTLADRSSSLPAILWDAGDEAIAAAQPGAAVHVSGRVGEHPRYGLQFTLT